MPGSGDSIRQRIPGLALGAVAIGVCLGLRATGTLEGLELAVYDRFVRGQDRADPGPAAVIGISIGEAEFSRYGFPIPDAVLARGLERLVDAGVTAIGVDLYRPGPASDSAGALEGWRELGRVVASHPRIVMSELLPSEGEPGTPAPPFARRPDQVGFNNLLVDGGRVVRRGYLIDWDSSGQGRLSLGLRLALLHLASQGLSMGPDPTEPDWIRLGATTLPPLERDFGAYADLDAGGYQVALDFARAPDAFETLTLTRIVEDGIDGAPLAGRVAIVGTDSPSVKDDFHAPLEPGRVVKGYRLHAQIVDQLVRAAEQGRAPMRDWSAAAETAWIVGWGLAGLALGLGLRRLGWAVPGLLMGAGLLLATSASLFSSGLWVPSVAPGLAWLGAGGVALGERAGREARARRQLMGLFRRFASRDVADALWRDRDRFMQGGRPRPQRLVLTALLSDLRGYTAAAEKLEPDALMAWIDSYMDAMTRVIEAHHGHVDDYVGDGIKANFGVPVPSREADEIARDAHRAVRCAIEMGRALEELNAEWSRRGWPTGRQRIGVYTGPAVVGAIGSEERLKYTSVGDTVNTAARLEAIGGALDFDREDSLQRILIGESTRRAVDGDFELEDLGAHLVKGKTEPLRIYRVHGLRRSDAEEVSP